jgi:ATP-dependent DNA helicase RecG
MTEIELQKYLIENYPQENEKCEWKEFKSLKHCISGKESDDVISYISAISNMEGGHLVIGVGDSTLDIVGIQEFHNYTTKNLKLKILLDCPNLPSEGLNIKEFITKDTNKTVWVFEIPKHPLRLPVYAHKKCWQRVNDSLIPITKSRLDAILNEIIILNDWTAKIANEATLEDLDKDAIAKARIEFVKRNPSKVEDEKTWDDAKFLDKAKLTINGQITNTALILLGRDESEHYLGSAVKIRWILRNLQEQNLASEVFSIPFILNVDKVFNSIRNLKYIYTKEDTLFPEEMPRYDVFTIREPLHNAIAHQDYNMKGYINVIEYQDDHLVFSNLGKFLPSSVEEVVLNDTPQENYRNPYLIAAMKNLNMIETEGGGIRKIYNFQRQRLFPMPDYDISDNKCKLVITGKVLNLDFGRILIKNPTLKLEDIILLDKVQKGHKDLTEQQISYLRKKRFVEGRKSNIYLSFNVIEPLGDEQLNAEYIANKSFDDEHFKKMIVEYIRKFGQTKRNTIDNLIIPKLSATLSENQKKNKVTNYLSSLRKTGIIESKEYATWNISNEFI